MIKLIKRIVRILWWPIKWAMFLMVWPFELYHRLRTYFSGSKA
jgi:hypothetical protein